MKINVAEILKLCPSGMLLECALFGSTIFEEVFDNRIVVRRLYNNSLYFLNEYGQICYGKDCKCLIFPCGPNGAMSWEEFQSIEVKQYAATNTALALSSCSLSPNRHPRPESPSASYRFPVVFFPSSNIL